MEQLITLNGIQPSRKTAEQIRIEIAQKVESGELDPIKVNASIKFFEKVFNGDDKKNNGLSHYIKPYVIDEIQKAPERKDYYGFEVSIKESGARYDFSMCNDSVLDELMEQEKELKAKIEERQNFLKSIKPGGHMIITIEETGENIKVFAPVKKSTTSPTFLLK
jgi:hypothetical protein